MPPGEIQFTLICGARLTASHFVKLINPDFDAEYAAGLKIFEFLYIQIGRASCRERV